MSSNSERKLMTVDRCYDWCLMAYAQTRAQGYFVASKFGTPSTDLLLSFAFQIGLVLDNPQGKGRVWYTVLEVPKMTDAKKLFNKYQEEQAASRDRAAAKRAEIKEAKQKAKQDAIDVVKKTESTKSNITKDDKIGQDMDAGFGGMYHRGTTVNDRLIRIEAKLGKLLSIWDESKSKAS